MFRAYWPIITDYDNSTELLLDISVSCMQLNGTVNIFNMTSCWKLQFTILFGARGGNALQTGEFPVHWDFSLTLSFRPL
jgi:hypothetical protein